MKQLVCKVNQNFLVLNPINTKKIRVPLLKNMNLLDQTLIN